MSSPTAIREDEEKESFIFHDPSLHTINFGDDSTLTKKSSTVFADRAKKGSCAKEETKMRQFEFATQTDDVDIYGTPLIG